MYVNYSLLASSNHLTLGIVHGAGGVSLLIPQRKALAVTETNAAYRTADHERWQNLDFVVGIEIHLSGNHTCKGRDGKKWIPVQNLNY